jgi:hypothetical protein
MEVPWSEKVTVALLKEFLEAFNRHDLDSIMSYFRRTAFSICREASRPGRSLCGKAGGAGWSGKTI